MIREEPGVGTGTPTGPQSCYRLEVIRESKCQAGVWRAVYEALRDEVSYSSARLLQRRLSDAGKDPYCGRDTGSQFEKSLPISLRVSNDGNRRHMQPHYSAWVVLAEKRRSSA